MSDAMRESLSILTSRIHDLSMAPSDCDAIGLNAELRRLEDERMNIEAAQDLLEEHGDPDETVGDLKARLLQEKRRIQRYLADQKKEVA